MFPIAVAKVFVNLQSSLWMYLCNPVTVKNELRALNLASKLVPNAKLPQCNPSHEASRFPGE